MREAFAAFVCHREIPLPEYGFDEEPVGWARKRLERAGLVLEVADWPPGWPWLDGLPMMTTRWLELPASVRVVDREDLRALVLSVSWSQFFTRAEIGGPAYRIAAATSFRDVCAAMLPTYAFFDTIPEEDVPAYLDAVNSEILGVDLDELASFGYPMWYVARAWVRSIPVSDRPLVRMAEELPVSEGAVVVRKPSLADWI
jgi:hypothetical protein